MKTGPSPHLTWQELACKDHLRTSYPERLRDTRARPLAATFEAIRARLGGRPITIGSAYRTRRHNTRVGGAADSMHLYGLALDLHAPADVTVDAMYATAAAVLEGKGGLFAYPWGIHIDRRDLIGRPPARGDFRTT